MKKLVRLILLLAIVGGVVYYMRQARPTPLVLTGIVTTNEIIVSPQIGGQLNQLLVKEGDTVTRNQLIGTITPSELTADRNFYKYGAESAASLVRTNEAALRLQERQTEDQISEAEATLASIVAQQAEAAAALENAQITMDRTQALSKQGVLPIQQFDQARTTLDGAKAHLNAVTKQVEAQRAAVAMARANSEQVDMKQSQLTDSKRQEAAASEQTTKADVRLSYSELRSPVGGTVDVRAALSGEVVNTGQPVITIIDPDNLWVRADVEETYIDRVRIGDKFTVRLPSGDERSGTVFYRGVDADFATQRDVSRTKRDIKTFEIRLRLDNSDRRLAVGMTTYILLPITP